MAREALAQHSYDQTGLRVIALPYLLLMQIDSARGIDRGDLTRMLGLLDDSALERVVQVVERDYGDPQAPSTCASTRSSAGWSTGRPTTDLLHQLALIGRLNA